MMMTLANQLLPNRGVTANLDERRSGLRFARDDSQGLVETDLPHVLRELLPMNPAVHGLGLGVRQTDLACPEALLKFTIGRHRRTLIYRRTGRCSQETHGVEHVRELSHQIESGLLVTIRRVTEILLKIKCLLRFVGHDHVGGRGKVGIPIVLERSFPVHQPETRAVEEHVVRLEQVVMSGRRIGIKTRVDRGHLPAASQEVLGILFQAE